MAKTLRQLQHVIALYEHRNYRRAAEAVHLTQSALSVSIQRIEAHYGVPLFIRDQGGVAPTEFGELVVRLARETTTRLAQGRREVELIRNREAGKVIVGADPWMADILVAPALTRLLHKYPKLRFRLRTQGWDEQQPSLLDRSIDVYVGSPFDAQDPAVAAQRFDLSSPVILCRHDHPLTALPRVDIRDVLPYPLLVPRLPRWYLLWLAENYGGGQTSEDLHDLFLQSDDFTVIRHVVRETDAITAGVTGWFPPELSRSEFAILDIADLAHIRSPVIVATLADRPVSVAAAAFMDEVIAEIQRISEAAPTAARGAPKATKPARRKPRAKR